MRTASEARTLIARDVVAVRSRTVGASSMVASVFDPGSDVLYPAREADDSIEAFGEAAPVVRLERCDVYLGPGSAASGSMMTSSRVTLSVEKLLEI